MPDETVEDYKPLEYESITIRAQPCATCGTKSYTPLHVIKGCAGVARCNACGRDLIVQNKFFELLWAIQNPLARSPGSKHTLRSAIS